MRHLTGNDVRGLFEDTPHLLFEVTEKCNFECSYCGYGKNYIQPAIRPLNANRKMRWETAKSILDTYFSIWKNPKYYNQHITISFYGGEPLLNYLLIERIVNYIIENKPESINIQYHITTNGFFLKKYFSFLKENNFKIDVSLDGDQIANAYRRFRNGKETFSIVKSNLDYIYNSFPEYFKNNLSFQSVINCNSPIIAVLSFFKSTYNTTTEIIEISKHNLCKGSNIPELFRDIKIDMENSFYKDPEVFKDLGIESPTKNKVRSSLKKVNPHNYETYLDFFKNNLSKNASRQKVSMTCFPFSGRMFVSTSGFIFPCEKADFEHALGQIVNNEIIIDYDRIANLYNTLYSSAEKLCSQCLNENDCGHCFLQDRELTEEGINRCPDFIKKTSSSIKENERYIINHIEDLYAIINEE
ncbi:MAG: radical SAM protein [Bacteroidales bacterium]|nr:radical SAM protein [Bacteroidales bacterium]